MTNNEYLAFVISCWKEIDESKDAIEDELENYEHNYSTMAWDYADNIVSDKEEWSQSFIDQAYKVFKSIDQQSAERTQLLKSIK